MLFELCDLGPLGNWLLGQNTVTEDLADKMITFSLHIARGLQELHAHKVTLYNICAICRVRFLVLTILLRNIDYKFVTTPVHQCKRVRMASSA